jgi:serine/threonine protein kinase
MASVHFARLLGPVGFSRTVAIKRLHANLRVQDEFVRMFLDEARLAARVRHPNVVATIDVVETDEQICLVMEYVHGESLRRLNRRAMAQGGRIPRRIAAAIMIGSLHGLHAAHEAKNERGEPLGLVHRDVSPHNILVGADGIPRVIDFGIAKARGRLREASSGNIKGKFAYMAPEQLVAGDVTRAADIYSASVVLWELLTGRRLFDSKMDASLLERATAKVERPSSIVPSLTPALDGIVLRGLSGDPENRFSSARAMARAIEDCIAPASTADVGEWVERMVKDRLDLREAALNELEGRDDGPEAGEGARVPDLDIPAMPAVRDRVPSDPLSAYAHTPSNSAVVPSSVVAAGSLFPPVLETDDPPGPPLETHSSPPAAARPPSDRARPMPEPWAREKPARRSPWGLLGFLLVVVLLGALVYEAPSYVRGRAAEAGAQHGLSVAVGEVVFRPSAVILTENHVAPVRLEGVTLGVGDVEVALHGLSPGGVLVRGFELTARGALGDVLASLARWASAQTSPELFEARSGHIVWTDLVGKGTVLEAWDTSVTASPGKLSLSSPSVMIRTARSKLGPYSVRIERSGADSGVAVSFGPPARGGAAGDTELAGRAHLIGDSLSSLALSDGELTLGSARASVSGTVTLAVSDLRVDLALQWWSGDRAILPAKLTFDSQDLAPKQ